MQNPVIFIGIDPGSISLGYSVLLHTSSLSLLKSGCLCFSKKDPLEHRLRFFFDFFSSLLADLFSQYPGVTVFFSLERPFFSKNASSSFVLHSFYSLGLLLSTYALTPPFIFSPCEVKMIVAGSGSATKQALSDRLLSFSPFLSLRDHSFDETDAIAISLAASFRYSNMPPSSS